MLAGRAQFVTALGGDDSAPAIASLAAPGRRDVRTGGRDPRVRTGDVSHEVEPPTRGGERRAHSHTASPNARYMCYCSQI